MSGGGQHGHDGFDGRFVELAVLAHRVAYRILGSAPDAEEVAQEALARAYARWGAVRGHAEPWIVRVATNLALGRWRKEQRSPRPVAGPLSQREDAMADRLDLLELLRRLPRRQRDTVVLRFLGDLSEQDTARALGVSVGTVKQHCHRALASLRLSLTASPADGSVIAGGCDVRRT